MTFTLSQIKEAHAKVKSGADFPKYIQDIVTIGVERYETFVSDGHTVYFSNDAFQLESESKYETLGIASSSNAEQFISDLKNHQQGGTDYMTFCKDCAKSGIEKWIVNIPNRTCSYYDQSGNEILVEQIPVP